MAVVFTPPEGLPGSAVPASVAQELFLPTKQKLVTDKQTEVVAAAALAIQVAKQVQVLAVMADQELLSFGI